MSRAAASPADLDDPEKYTALPEAEVFDEHVRFKVGGDGKPTKEVAFRADKAWLEKYAAGCNKRDADGCPPAMSIGHTVDGAPEKDQPEIIGAWRKFNVAWSPEKKRWVLRCTPYVRKGREDEARSYPRVSIEAWRHMPVIDPIAILRRTPERPAQWTYAAAGDRWRFSMEDANVGDPLDPTAAPDAAAPDDEFTQKFSACMASMYPHMQAMHEKFAAGLAAPGATPAMTAPNPAAPAPDAAERERFSALERENKDLKTRLDAAEREGREVKRRGDLQKFAAFLDVDAEVKDALDMTPEQYGKHLSRIERLAKIAGDPADPTRGPDVDVSGAAGPRSFGVAELEKAQQYMASHADKLTGLPYDQAWDRAKKFAMTGKDS